MDLTTAAAPLARFLESHSAEQTSEALWWCALTMIDRAASAARQANERRWQHHPKGELRQLRRELAAALITARLAATIQEQENEAWRRRDLAGDLLQRVRSRQAKPAPEETRRRVVARLARLRSKRLGRELELWQTPPAEDFAWADRRMQEIEHNRAAGASR